MKAQPGYAFNGWWIRGSHKSPTCKNSTLIFIESLPIVRVSTKYQINKAYWKSEERTKIFQHSGTPYLQPLEKLIHPSVLLYLPTLQSYPEYYHHAELRSRFDGMCPHVPSEHGQSLGPSPEEVTAQRYKMINYTKWYRLLLSTINKQTT